MKVQVKEWGNSQAIKIPKEILQDAGISTNEVLNISATNGAVVLSKAFQHRTLEERAAEHEGRLNLDGECDWGNCRPLHIFIQTEQMQGYVQCEKLTLLDLSVRGYKKIDQVALGQRINIVDAIQGIFDYV